MLKYIVIFNHNIDDVEIHGFNIMTEKDLSSFEELAYSIDWPFIYELGETEIEYSSGEELLTFLEYKEISNEEYKTLKKVFPDGFGVFINEEYLQSILDEGSEDIGEDDSDDFYDYGENNDYDEDF